MDLRKTNATHCHAMPHSLGSWLDIPTAGARDFSHLSFFQQLFYANVANKMFRNFEKKGEFYKFITIFLSLDKLFSLNKGTGLCVDDPNYLMKM